MVYVHYPSLLSGLTIIYFQNTTKQLFLATSPSSQYNNPKMTHEEIRKKFIDFFVSKDHKLVPSSSLVPEDDPSVLLTTAGVQQFKPYMLNQKDVLKDFGTRRLCSIQKSFRTSDIEEVGDKDHLTFFEMLGNFSIGDYFKREAIEWAWEFLTKVCKLDPKNMYVTVFAGDPPEADRGGVPEDKEAIEIWKEVAGENIRIEKFGREDNFWGPTGSSGPCGPCSEIIYVFENGKETELWNLVFTELFQDEGGSLSPLEPKNIDTGMGMERLTLILQNKSTVFETDLFKPIFGTVEDLAEVGPPSPKLRGVESLRIIADHTRAATFLAGDGVTPSNSGRGYVLRRIIRRAVRHGQLLDINGIFLGQLVEKVLEIYGEQYPNLLEKQNKISETIEGEERKFGQTLKRGLKELEKIVSKCQSVKVSKIPGGDAFKLYDTYGFPLDLTIEIAKEKGFAVDTGGFEKEMEKQKERARAAKKFTEYKPEETAPLHTATHLLNQALREVLGGDVHQAGQDLSPERLRFDFTYDRKLTEIELRRIEETVNDWIKKDVPVECVEATYDEAIKQGAEALFAEKYKQADKVTMYKIGNVSKELCAGPHVKSTGELGSFKIVKQESVGQGVRRIYANV